MSNKTLAELNAIGVSMVAQANLDSEVPDDVLAQRILDEADPSFVGELGRALSRQKLVMWIHAERRKAQQRISASGDDKIEH
jgi:hypothetical protein